MTFLNPAGLWGLLGIPVLILIYIIKPKFEERPVPSTFIWKLSLKYRKRRVPFQWLKQILLILLQILAIILISLILAKPVLLSNDGSSEKIIILDASASMNAVQDGETRFDRAINEICEQIDSLGADGKMTIIYAGSSAECIAERLDSAYSLGKCLERLSCTQGSADISGALELARKVLAENEDAEVILCTDKTYEESNGITVINVAGTEWNTAILSFTEKSVTRNAYTFSSELVSYGREAEITIALYIDDELIDAQIVSLKDSEIQELLWEDIVLNGYTKAELYLEAGDALLEDNELYLFSEDSRQLSVLIVSETPNFLKTVLKSVGSFDVTVTESTEELSGYQLYIFDGIMPDSLPDDGSVWIFDPVSVPWGLNIALGETVTGEAYLKAAADPDTELYKLLTQYIDPGDIAVAEYTKLQSYSGYEAVLSCDGSPVVLAGESDNLRTVVFLFDIHDSNLPLLIEFPQVISAMTEYSLPEPLDQDIYTVGDTVTVTALSGVRAVTVEAGAGSSASSLGGLSTDITAATGTNYYEFPVAFTAESTGIGLVQELYEDGTAVTREYFVRLAESESNIYAAGGILGMSLASEEEKEEKEEKTYVKELWLYLAAVLLMLAVLEWEVQYREQF